MFSFGSGLSTTLFTFSIQTIFQEEGIFTDFQNVSFRLFRFRVLAIRTAGSLAVLRMINLYKNSVMNCLRCVSGSSDQCMFAWIWWIKLFWNSFTRIWQHKSNPCIAPLKRRRNPDRVAGSKWESSDFFTEKQL